MEKGLLKPKRASRTKKNEPLVLPECLPNRDLYLIQEREEVMYQPARIKRELEDAYLRYCRFSRTIISRRRAHCTRSPLGKTKDKVVFTPIDRNILCGDMLIDDALKVLHEYDYNVVQAVYYLRYHEENYCFSKKRKYFNNPALDRLGYNIREKGPTFSGSSLADIFAFHPQTFSGGFLVSRNRRPLKALRYLYHVYHQYITTESGSHWLERYLNKTFTKDKTIKTFPTSNCLVYHNVEKLCPYCKKETFKAGKEMKMMCDSCERYMSFMDSLYQYKQVIYLSPTVFKWDKLHCYELSIKLPKTRSRSKSLPSRNEIKWNTTIAKKCLSSFEMLKKAS